MTRLLQKQLILPIYGEYVASHDSTWGCLHILRGIAPSPKLILRAGLDDFRFYIARRGRKQSVTLITLDLVAHPRLSPDAHRIEKPLYLCPACRDLILARIPVSHLVYLPDYRDRILYARSASARAGLKPRP